MATRSVQYEAIRKNPEDFGIGILARNVETKERSQLESSYIKIKNSVANGFNQNYGGALVSNA